MEADVLVADTMPLKGGISTRRGRIRSRDAAFELDVHMYPD